MKLDIKSILIVILLGFTLIFGYKWYFGNNNEYKDKLNQLQDRYDEIEKEKKESNKRLEDNAFVIDSLLFVDSLNNQKIALLEFNVREAEDKANESAGKLSKVQKELADTRKKIKEFKNNPPNRTGDDLLNSIKNKTK
jgi:peptidoglycan hydrolase CwlO-like protein